MRKKIVVLTLAAMLASGVAYAQSSSSSAPVASSSQASSSQASSSQASSSQASSSSRAPSGASSAAPAAASATPAAGKTVLDGVYTDAQADQGAELISANCSMCHANTMRGGPGGPSVIANLYTMFGDQPLSGFFDYISTQMPLGNPGSLAPEEYAAITARVLQLVKAPSGSTELPADDAGLEQIMLVQKK